jgi:hypothetical protein
MNVALTAAEDIFNAVQGPAFVALGAAFPQFAPFIPAFKAVIAGGETILNEAIAGTSFADIVNQLVMHNTAGQPNAPALAPTAAAPKT